MDRASADAQLHAHAHNHAHVQQISAELMMESALDDHSGASDVVDMATGLRRKRSELEPGHPGDEYDDDDDDDAASEDVKDGKMGTARAGSGGNSNKRQRRHNWQPKYEMEFGLIPIERDSATGDVTLAMCGFCKSFGREGKYEQLLAGESDGPAGASNAPAGPTVGSAGSAATAAAAAAAAASLAMNDPLKKRRRRSLTTTKFFRAFRVDNIRSHLQGAHPRRWSEYEALPKQEAIRTRYLQMQGEFQYDGISMVDDVLSGSTLTPTDSDIAYAQAHVHAHTQSMSHTQNAHAQAAMAAAAAAMQADMTPATSSASTTTAHSAAVPTNMNQISTTMVYGGNHDMHETPTNMRKRNNRLVAAMPPSNQRSHAFDYEKHLTEQLALDRERLEFEKAKFKKEVELRERELAQREKMMHHEREQRDKDRETNLERARIENSKFMRLTELLRDAVATANGVGVPAGSVV